VGNKVSDLYTVFDLVMLYALSVNAEIHYYESFSCELALTTIACFKIIRCYMHLHIRASTMRTY